MLLQQSGAHITEAVQACLQHCHDINAALDVCLRVVSRVNRAITVTWPADQVCNGADDCPGRLVAPPSSRSSSRLLFLILRQGSPIKISRTSQPSTEQGLMIPASEI